MSDGAQKKRPRSRPRTPKGYRPNNLGDVHLERILSITMALATEVSVLHEKIDTIARLSESQRSFTLADIEAYEPTDDVKYERSKWREDYLKRILRIMWEDIPDTREATQKTYTDVIRSVSED